MSAATALLLVAVAGGLGAAARFVVDGAVRARTPCAAFPWATVVVNVSGSLVIGLVTGVLLGAGDPASLEPWRIGVATGFCGGYTTFSTAMVEAVRLARSGRRRLAVANALGTMALTLIAVVVGIGLGVLVGRLL
ncbi:fluoride efflux transporter FluC [Krasilnikoviella flava]|uniref:Fluoride-specific ion channel FluC n=1 Tax=Krasilnikoviella flava TaxID=526729 RepID=A0A1T5K0S1_9MICO|nr:CrcB family protein [Krasilnikoviella flava]SKC57105.1 CrcB protein [Krasilnikoviella flava]